MSQTYTSTTLAVSDGEITSHDTAGVASDINILSAECRWQGVEGTETSTVISSNDTVTYPSDTGDWTDTTNKSWSGTVPDISQGSFVDHYVELQIENLEGIDLAFDWSIDYSWTGGGTDYNGNGTVVPADDTGLFTDHLFSDELSTNCIGETVETFVTWSAVDTDNPPSSVDVDVALDLSTRYAYDQTSTVQTQDPFVTRDVDGSYTGTLSDGEWSSWVTLNGLQTGVNEFYHNISGSAEAKFEFRYDWEYAYPEPIHEMCFYDADQGAIHRVALADPGSARLDYNHHRYAVNGTTLALDVVDPGDPDAVAFVRWSHPTHGTYCPRSFETMDV